MGKLNIISSVGHEKKLVGAVDISSYSIINDYVTMGFCVNNFPIPSKRENSMINLITKNFMLLFNIVKLVSQNQDLVFIYPTIPLAPTTKQWKYFIACAYYRLVFCIKSNSKSKFIIHILDFPVEQDVGLGISNVKIKHSLLKNFERRFISEFDIIITYSAGFNKILLDTCPGVDNKIVQYTCLSLVEGEKKKIELDDSIKLLINKFDVKIFYSGDLSREYEKNMLIDLFKRVDDNTCVILCGNNGDWIRERVRKENIYYVGFVDSFKHDLIAKSCDFGVLLYPNTGYYKITPTTKLSSYVNNCLPIIAIRTETNEKIIERYQIGMCTDENNVVDLILNWCKTKKYSQFKKRLSDYSTRIFNRDAMRILSERIGGEV